MILEILKKNSKSCPQIWNLLCGFGTTQMFLLMNSNDRRANSLQNKFAKDANWTRKSALQSKDFYDPGQIVSYTYVFILGYNINCSVLAFNTVSICHLNQDTVYIIASSSSTFFLFIPLIEFKS